MVSDYFYDIDMIEKEETADDLGGFITRYKKVATIKGILTQSNATERTIASQLGIQYIYTFMTETPLDIKKDTIVKKGNITAILNSDLMQGEETSEEMSKIYQAQAKSYDIPSGVEIEWQTSLNY